MKKSLAKLSAYEQHKMKWTVRFGYAMFAIVVVNTLIMWSSFVYGLTLLHGPVGPLFTQFAWYLITSGLGAILPPLVAYLVGERGGKTNTKYEHRYNGVLFAILASWLSIASSLYPWTYDAMAYMPAVSAGIALVTALIIAFVYGRHKKPISLERYLPYQLALTMTIALIVVSGLVSTLQALDVAKNPSLYALIGAEVLICCIVLWAGYRASRESGRWPRLIDSIIALSISVWTINLSMMLLMYLHVATLINIAPVLLGILCWGVYLYLIHLRITASSGQTALKR